MQSLSITCRQRSPPCFTCSSWKTTNQHFNNNTSVSFIVLHIFCTLDVKSAQSASCCWLRDYVKWHMSHFIYYHFFFSWQSAAEWLCCTRSFLCQSGQHPESSLSTRLLLLPDSSQCVFMCVRATWHPQSLRAHRGVWDSENPPRSCSTRDARSCAQHKGLCTSGSWCCSWFFLFHLLHFETNWQQHFTDPRSVSVKLKTELDHCKRGNCPHAVLYVSCLCCSNGVMQHHLSVVDGRWSPQMEKDHDVQSYVIKQKTMQCGWFLKELNVCPVVSSTVCSVLFSSRRSLK